MRESRTSGSVEGVMSNHGSYSDQPTNATRWDLVTNKMHAA